MSTNLVGQDGGDSVVVRHSSYECQDLVEPGLSRLQLGCSSARPSYSDLKRLMMESTISRENLENEESHWLLTYDCNCDKTSPIMS